MGAVGAAALKGTAAAPRFLAARQRGGFAHARGRPVREGVRPRAGERHRVRAVGAAALNAILIRTERALTVAPGLPRRPWFRHAVYAPGFYTGYGVKTLPGVREAIEQRNWKEADAQIAIAASALSAEGDVLGRAAAQLEQLAP